jgi:hypothetical protein
MWFAELFQDNKAHVKAIGNPQGPAPAVAARVFVRSPPLLPRQARP